jgi:hypothetical protein
MGLLTSLVVAAVLAVVGEFKRTRERHIQGYRCSGAVYGWVTDVTCTLQQKRIHWRA